MAADGDIESPPTATVATVAIGQLGSASDLVREVTRTGQQAIVTDNGVEVAVILDMAAYRALHARRDPPDLRATLLRALEEMDAGSSVDDSTVVASIQAEFDAPTPSGQSPHSSS